MNVLKLSPHVRTASAIYSFLSGGMYIQALDTIGGVHIEAVKREVEKLNHAANKREAVNRILTHLGAAHVALEKSWRSPVTSNFRLVRAETVASQDIKVCCLIAMCHKLLGDSQASIENAISDARKAYDFLEPENVSLGKNGAYLFNIVSPLTYIDLMRPENGLDKKATKEELDKFIEAINTNEFDSNQDFPKLWF